MKFIEDMRERPEEERFAFAVLAAGAVAVILFFVWGATFFSGSVASSEPLNETPSQSASAIEGFRDLGKEFTNATGEFTAQYEQLKRALDDAGLGDTPVGVNTVDLSVDENGDVQVKNIVIEKEINTEQ